jgi:hypothetical protein
MIPALCLVYGLIAAAGLYVAVVGQKTAPAPLPLIDTTGTRTEQLAQAKRMMVQAQQQQPDHVILTMFYKGWLLEFDYRDLSKYSKPLFEGDSWEKRIKSYNRTAGDIDWIYADAVTTLAFLSSGSLILIILMLWIPSYLPAVLLAGFPIVVVLICAVLGINSDPLEWIWIPFIVPGGFVFVFQLIFSFRYGPPRHRTPEGLPGLVLYRRGLFMVNFGIFLLAGAVVMATGSSVGSGRSMRTSLGLALFGEGGVVIIGFVLGVLLVLPGVYYMWRQPSEGGV